MGIYWRAGQNAASPPGVFPLVRSLFKRVHLREVVTMPRGRAELQHGYAREGSPDWYIFVRKGMSVSELNNALSQMLANREFRSCQVHDWQRRELADAIVLPEAAALMSETESAQAVAIRLGTTTELIERRRHSLAAYALGPTRARAKVIDIRSARTLRLPTTQFLRGGGG